MTAIDLTPHKSLRLAVSGDVSLNRLETSLVDTADFQRLRQIRQLGPCHLVYPTALHTRFDHSLGTLSMAIRMLESIDTPQTITPEQTQIARLFALLHDVFHIPFGHTLEDEFAVFTRHDDSPERIERFTGANSPIGRSIIKSLGTDLHERLMRLFYMKEILPEDHFILDLVTNTICADLLDYLQRDAFFCNISMDSDYRFLRHLTLVNHEGRTRLAIRLWKEGRSTPRRDVLNELIRLLDNRYLLGERVYFHHAKLVAGTMIAAAVARACLCGELRESDMYALGDDTLLYRLSQSREESVKRLAVCIANRSLWKRFYERGRSMVLAEQHSRRTMNILQDLMERFHRDASRRVATEDRLAGLLGMAPGDLLIYCPDSRMSMKLADCMVFWNGELRPLKDCTDDELVGAKLKSILDSHQNLWAIRAFVNPRHTAKMDEAADAFDALLTYEPSRRKRSTKAFYSSVMRRMTQKLKAVDQSRRQDLIEQGTNHLLALPEDNRSVETINAWMRQQQ